MQISKGKNIKAVSATLAFSNGALIARSEALWMLKSWKQSRITMVQFNLLLEPSFHIMDKNN